MQQEQKTYRSGTWSSTENNRLSEAVAKYGTRWVSVASEVGTRNGDQCAKRWMENLNPELDHSPWTVEEARLSMGALAYNSRLEGRWLICLRCRKKDW